MERISKHISWKEGTHSNTATRRGIDNTPNQEQLNAMKALAKNVFEPIRNHFGKPIRVNSFFRSVKLNKAIGGSSTSQHCKGEAIDLDAIGFTNKEIYNYIKDNLEFDQLIGEGKDSNGDFLWVHVSYKYEGLNRKQTLVADFSSGKAKYSKYI